VALSHSPSIVTNGLVLCLDAANRKGYDKFENLMTSSQLGNTILNDGGAVTLTTDTTIASPFGGSDGVLKCVHTTNTPGYFRRGQNMSLTAGVTYTFSFYFKNGTVSNPYGQIPINFGITISTYTPTFQTIETALNTNIDVGNGWYRQVVTFTPSYTQTYQVNFNQANNQTLVGTYYLYGFQLEIGSSVTDYYATTSTAKNRGTILSDLSGRGNTGTLTNGVGYGNSNSGSFVFDGVNDCVVVNNNASILSSTSYTKIAWFYPTSFATLNNIISGVNGLSEHAFWLAGGNTLNAGHNGSWSTVVSSTTLSLNTWYCGAVTFSTTTGWVLYLNGVQEATNLSTTTFSGTGAILIGAFATGDFVFTGRIANTKIYNRVLSAAEVRQNFNALRGRFGI
jgi:hypothetical protein